MLCNLNFIALCQGERMSVRRSSRRGTFVQFIAILIFRGTVWDLLTTVLMTDNEYERRRWPNGSRMVYFTYPSYVLDGWIVSAFLYSQIKKHSISVVRFYVSEPVMGSLLKFINVVKGNAVCYLIARLRKWFFLLCKLTWKIIITLSCI